MPATKFNPDDSLGAPLTAASDSVFTMPGANPPPSSVVSAPLVAALLHMSTMPDANSSLFGRVVQPSRLQHLFFLLAAGSAIRTVVNDGRGVRR